MHIPGFDSKIAAELDALHQELAASNHPEDIVVRESIAYKRAMDKPGVERAKLRWMIATGHLDRMQRGRAA